ncbi:MAG: PD40 domain-containing protein [Alphaproteobacteria bacterium]|nr:PD40 domain-containing protein [Alphaproteobacteria bacterium]MCB9695453.1 PD40 domain-containing protein [Alphaproteobacteria bacterium]
MAAPFVDGVLATPAPVVLGEDVGASFPGDADPSGRHGLVVSATDGPGGHVETLWVTTLDGSAPPRALTAAQMVRNPEWSRDGTSITFESDAISFRDLFRVPVAGGQGVRVTDAPNGTFEPAISFDGQRLAMGTSRDGNAEIWVAAADGSDQTRFTDHPNDDVHPAWLPDGRLSWISYRSGRPRVWIRDTDGTEHPLRPADGDATDLDIAWSPGGIAAVVVQTGPKDIQLELRTAHGGLIALLDGPGPDEHPSWSPDGERLVFSSSRSGNPQLWMATAGGTDPVQLTSCAKACWLPRWIPAPG